MVPRVLMIEPEPIVQQRNHLLDSLGHDDRGLLFPHLTYVRLDGGACLSTMSADGPVACFPLSLVVSAVQVMADGSRYEVGLIGSEGMIGWTGNLDFAHQANAHQANAHQANAHQANAHQDCVGNAKLGGGAALIVSVPVLAALCRQSPTLHAAMLAFTQSFAVQMRHTVVSNLRDGIERRLARWLMMLHDRIDGDLLAVTHGDLAATLNVRRASITDTLHILEGDHVVRCTRGSLMIRDRTALTRIAGDSYGPAEASYRALIGAFGKG